MPLLDVEGCFENVREEGEVIFHPLFFFLFDQFLLAIHDPVEVPLLLSGLHHARILEHFGMFLTVVKGFSVVLDRHEQGIVFPAADEVFPLRPPS